MVLIMARTVSTPKLFSSSNVSATFAFVGLVGAALAFSNFNTVYAYDSGASNAGTFKTYVRINAAKGEGNTHAMSKIKKPSEQNKIQVHHNKPAGINLNNHSRRKIARKTIKNAFSNIRHDDTRTVIIVNTDSSNAERNAGTGALVLQGRGNLIQPSAKGTKTNIIRLASNTRRNNSKLNSPQNATQYPAKATGLKLVAGGTNKRIVSKSTKLNNGDTVERNRSGITGLQEVVFPKNKLQFVAGNGQNLLASHIAKNCTNTDFCILSNHVAEPFKQAKKIELTSLAVNEKFAEKSHRPLPKKVSKPATKNANDDLPTVIMLDETF